MPCGFDKGLIAAYYDGEADPAERAEVERHVASCPECARDLADMKELTGRLKGLGRATAPATLAPAVAKEIGLRRAAPPSRRWMGWSVSAAAALLLAIGTVMLLDRSAHEHPMALAPEAPLREYQDSEEAKPMNRAAPAPAAEKPAAKKAETPGPPVLVVSATDPSKARAEVEAFLRERARASAPPKDGFGKDDVDLTPYLEVELTEEESRDLEARLRKIESVTIAKSTIEAELKKDRENQGLTMKDRVGRSRTAPPSAPAAEGEKREEPARSAVGPAPRRPIVFVFRQAPKK